MHTYSCKLFIYTGCLLANKLWKASSLTCWLPDCALMSLSQCLLSYLELDKYKTFQWHCYKSHFIDASQYEMPAAVSWCLFALEGIVFYKYRSEVFLCHGDCWGKIFFWGTWEVFACIWKRTTLPVAFHSNQFLNCARLLLILSTNITWN